MILEAKFTESNHELPCDASVSVVVKEGGGESFDQYTFDITENGTTTLATAGKYCDRNIDVNVGVPSFETELAEQKAITNSIIDRTITGHYENNEISSVGNYAFAQCKKIESINFPNAIVIYGYAFDNCQNLKIAELPMVNEIQHPSFRNCAQLEKFILRGDSVASLSNTNVFLYSGIANGTGYIYVPDELVDSYKAATNWSAYANQIKPLSELGE